MNKISRDTNQHITVNQISCISSEHLEFDIFFLFQPEAGRNERPRAGQSGGRGFLVCQPFCPIQAIGGPNEAHPHWGGR